MHQVRWCSLVLIIYIYCQTSDSIVCYQLRQSTTCLEVEKLLSNRSGKFSKFYPWLYDLHFPWWKKKMHINPRCTVIPTACNVNLIVFARSPTDAVWLKLQLDVSQVQNAVCTVCLQLWKLVFRVETQWHTHVTFRTALLKKCRSFTSLIGKNTGGCCSMHPGETSNKDGDFLSFQLKSKRRLELLCVFYWPCHLQTCFTALCSSSEKWHSIIKRLQGDKSYV